MEKLEIRAVIKYFCKKGMLPKEIHEAFMETRMLRMLTYDQKRTQPDISMYFLSRFEDDPGDFMERIITHEICHQGALQTEQLFKGLSLEIS